MIYSSDDGAVTVTDLINYLKSHVAADTTTAVTVDGMKLTVLQAEEDPSNNPPEFADSSFLWRSWGFHTHLDNCNCLNTTVSQNNLKCLSY